MSLTYENGQLTVGRTRGGRRDGRGRPHTMSHRQGDSSQAPHRQTAAVVRGPRRGLHDQGPSWNASTSCEKEAGGNWHANPRNLTAGTLKLARCENSTCHAQPQSFFAYSLGDSDGLDVEYAPRSAETAQSYGSPSTRTRIPARHRRGHRLLPHLGRQNGTRWPTRPMAWSSRSIASNSANGLA